MGIHYEVKNFEISQNVQKEDWFLRINPNGRIPAIVDKTATSDGKTREKRIFESRALILYLCQRYDPENRLNYSYDTDQYWEVVQWLVWMQSGLGPMQTRQSRQHHIVQLGLTLSQVKRINFYRYALEKIEYGIKRYQTETRRLYQVLEDRLALQAKTIDKEGPWIVGDRMTTADIANFAWVKAGGMGGYPCDAL